MRYLEPAVSVEYIKLEVEQALRNALPRALEQSGAVLVQKVEYESLLAVAVAAEHPDLQRAIEWGEGELYPCADTARAVAALEKALARLIEIGGKP